MSTLHRPEQGLVPANLDQVPEELSSVTTAKMDDMCVFYENEMRWKRI